MSNISQSIEQILRTLDTSRLYALKMRTKIGEEDLKDSILASFGDEDCKVILEFINKRGIDEFNRILEKVLKEYSSMEIKESTKIRLTTKTAKFSHLTDILREIPKDELIELKTKLDEGFKQAKLWLWDKAKWGEEPYATLLKTIESRKLKELKTAVVMSLQLLEEKADAAILTKKDKRKIRPSAEVTHLKFTRRRKIHKKTKLPSELVKELEENLKKKR